jgi:hypothetical protein
MTDIIASITERPLGWAVILYVETFKTDIIVFIVNIRMYLKSTILSIRVTLLILIIPLFQKKNIHITDKIDLTTPVLHSEY